MNSAAQPAPIWLCADDYGISPGVNRAICDLIARGRLNATSVMVVGPAIDRDEIAALQGAANASPRCALGLHATLTAPFRPLSMHFRPLGLLRQLDPHIIHAELKLQLATFAGMFGRVPDFVDGHQHVQLYPAVRDAFLDAVNELAPKAWVRQTGRAAPLFDRLAAPKALFLDMLSAQFRARAARAGIKVNPAFAGAYDFSRKPDFAALMRGFLDHLPAQAVVMCHPGFVDEQLSSLDPFTDQREREHAYLAGEQFPALLAEKQLTLG
jgi:chitin disaccharide deacetylase